MKKLAAHQVALVSQLTDFAVQLCHFQSDLMTAESELRVTAVSGLVLTAESQLMMSTESELKTTAELELLTAAESESIGLADYVQHRAHEPA